MVEFITGESGGLVWERGAKLIHVAQDYLSRLLALFTLVLRR